MALGYSGAGPYPQTYYDQKNDHSKLIKEAKLKENKFINSKKYCSYLKLITFTFCWKIYSWW